MTTTESEPDYPEKVAAYLKKSGARRMPWGALVSGGAITYTTSAADRRARAELGETAIRVLCALGVSLTELDELDEFPESTAPEDLVRALEILRTPPPTNLG